MAKKSRLVETGHSVHNLRETYISKQASYIAALRDEAMFSNWGVNVLVRVPTTSEGLLNENNVDEYSNFVDIEYSESTETVIPRFSEYRQNVSEDGMSADGTDALYPLEVLIPTKLHLPRNSRLIFNEYNSREEMISREWVVLGTEMKQLSGSKTYTRIASCVPAREDTYKPTNSWDVSLTFEGTVSGLVKNKDLRAIGKLEFIETPIKDKDFVRYFENPDASGPEGLSPQIIHPKYLISLENTSYFKSKAVTASVLY